MKNSNQKTFLVRIYGFEKGTISAATAYRAMIRASFIWANGNTRGISVQETATLNNKKTTL